MSDFQAQMFLPGGLAREVGPVPPAYVKGIAIGVSFNVVLSFGTLLLAANVKNPIVKAGALATCAAFNGYQLYYYSKTHITEGSY